MNAEVKRGRMSMRRDGLTDGHPGVFVEFPLELFGPRFISVVKPFCHFVESRRKKSGLTGD